MTSASSVTLTATAGTINESSTADATADITAPAINLTANAGIGTFGAFQISGTSLDLSGGTGPAFSDRTGVGA